MPPSRRYLLASVYRISPRRIKQTRGISVSPYPHQQSHKERSPYLLSSSGGRDWSWARVRWNRIKVPVWLLSDHRLLITGPQSNIQSPLTELDYAVVCTIMLITACSRLNSMWCWYGFLFLRSWSRNRYWDGYIKFESSMLPHFMPVFVNQSIEISWFGQVFWSHTCTYMMSTHACLHAQMQIFDQRLLGQW
jgi:hypothetical protein